MHHENSTNKNFSSSPISLRGFAVALVFLAGVASGVLSAQGGGRGGGPRVSGVVTTVAASSVTIKNEAGVAYTVSITADSRIMRRDQGQMAEINPTDIKVGDVVSAGGTIDDSAHTVAATSVLDTTGDAAAALVANEANLGKTWVAGKVTAISGTTITVLCGDGNSRTISANDTTSFLRAPQRGGGGGGAAAPDPITLADIKVGDNLSATGALSGTNFVPAKVTVGGQAAGYGGPQAGMGGGRRQQ
jgi:hypothetical protein